MRQVMCGIGALAALAIATIGGCTYYQTAPGTYSTSAPSKFDRSWSAALGAFDDQGVDVTYQNRDSGTIQGTRDQINVVATVRTQADGSVRVQFDTSGNTDRDPTLIERVSRAYDRLMGR